MRIRLLGRPAVLDHRGRPQALRGLQAWALLARILLAPRPVARRELAEELFPDTVDPLGSLRWCLASLRRALGAREALRGDPVEPNLPGDTEVDVHRLEDGDLDLEQAGDLLEGVEPRCAPQLATWLLVERERTASLIDARIRRDAIRALAAADRGQAIRLSRLAVRRRPLDEGSNVLLVKSLTLAGHHDAALAHVEATERALRAELGVEPSAALRSAARRTVASPPAGIGPRAVVRSQLDAGLAALAAGAVDAGVDCLRRAAAQAENCGDAELHAAVLLELGSALVHAVRSHDDEGSIVLRQAADLARQAGNAKVAGAALRELGYVDALAGRRPAAAGHLDEALRACEGDGEGLAGVHGVIGFNLVDWGRTGEGLEHYALSLEHARRAGNPRREAWSLGLGGWGQLIAGCPQRAARWLTDCLAIVDDLRWVAFRPWPLAVLAETRLRMAGDSSSLRSDLEETFALSCQLADPCWEGAAARTLALSHAAAGELEAAGDWITEARARCMRETDVYVGLRAAVLATDAEISGRAGRAEHADAAVRELLALAAKTHMDGYLRETLGHIGRP